MSWSSCTRRNLETSGSVWGLRVRNPQDGIQHLIVIANYKEVRSFLEGNTVPILQRTNSLAF